MGMVEQWVHLQNNPEEGQKSLCTIELFQILTGILT